MRDLLVHEQLEPRMLLAMVPTPELLGDINLNADSDPQNIVDVGGIAYFRADDGTHGYELWKSDGTDSGTVLVKDVNPRSSAYTGPYSGVWPELANFNGTLFFAGNDGDTGVQLWKSDGTESGTTLVKEVNTGGTSFGPDHLTVVDGTLFFFAESDQLWKTDGTSSGTVLVKDIQPGNANARPFEVTASGGKLFFAIDDGMNGRELWVSDGSESGTTLLRDINPGVSTSNPVLVTDVNGTAFFQANDGVVGAELWKSDGTPTGTVLVKDFASGSSFPRGLVSFQNKLFFSVSDGVIGSELWTSDGTESGTVLFKDIWDSGAFGSDPEPLAVAGSTLFFTAQFDFGSGRELWKTDGTASGTVLVKDIRPNVGSYRSSYIQQATAVGNTLFFTADDGTAGYELWKSDGTASGTVLVKDTASGPNMVGGGPLELAAVGTHLFFSADNGVDGRELWSSDGTTSGTAQVKNIRPGTDGSYPMWLTDVGGSLFFGAESMGDVFSSQYLWKSDGSASGTVQLTSFDGSSPGWITDVGGTAFFSASGSSTNLELWKSDGTISGTTLVKDIASGFYSSSPRYLTNVGGTLFFQANDRTSGIELWKSDGTDSGTVLVKDISSGGGNSTPRQLTDVNGTLFFTANDGVNGEELWKSDGTVSGTVLVKDILSGSQGSRPIYLTNVNGTLFFRTSDRRLWKSDGTESGTVMVGDVFSVRQIVSFQGEAFFVGQGNNGPELWRSDGTDSGTVEVKDIFPGNSYLDPRPRDLTVVGSTLFFAADGGSTGHELWKSDGTESGTVPVKDIWPGSDSSQLGDLTAVGSNVFFTANDGTSGKELWVSDGSSSGTVMVADLKSGPDGSRPRNLTQSGGSLYFAADDGTTGVELWGLISGPNLPPDAVDDIAGEVALSEDGGPGPVDITDAVLANDTDPNFDPLTITSINDTTTLGTLTLTGNVLTYDPGTDFDFLRPGQTDTTQSFGYTIDDGRDGQDSATVTITITGLNDAPTAGIDQRGTNESGPSLVINVLENDDDADTGDTLTVTGTSGGIGDVGFDASTVTYDPNGQFEYLAADETFDDVFQYTVSDGTVPVQGTITVTITGENDIPTADNDAAEMLVTDPPLVIRVLDNDNDIDLVDTLTVTNIMGQVGNATTNGTVINYSPTVTLEAGETLVDTFTYEINDGNGGTASAMVTVTIRGVTPGLPVRVSDVGPGANLGVSGPLVNVNGTLFFEANDAVTGNELWKSDGTVVGTTLVKDIVQVGESYVRNLTAVADTLFFTANDGVNGVELWKSDGTESGTVMVKDIDPGPNSSSPSHLTNVGGTLFFSAAQEGTGGELWMSDGTASGTVLVGDIIPGDGGLGPDNLTDFNGTLFFTGSDGDGIELWTSDGTANGTVQVADIAPGALSSEPRYLSPFGSTLFFSAVADGDRDRELWKYEGGTVSLVKDINPGQLGSGPLGESGFFLAAAAVPDPVNNPDQKLIVFSADDGVNGRELWSTDGTASGTMLVKDIFSGSNRSRPLFLTEFNNDVFFQARDIENTWELWKSNGTPGGTTLVKDIAPGGAGSFPEDLTVANGILYFSAQGSFDNSELWQTDGTSSGTVQVAEINPSRGSGPSLLTNVNETLFFRANDGTTGNELWKVPIAGQRPPVATDDVNGEVTVGEDGGPGPIDVTSNILANDFDPDSGDTFDVVMVDDMTTIGALDLTAGVVTYDPDGQFETLPLDGSATDTFTYTIRDSDGLEDTASVTVVITGANDAPTAGSDMDETNEDAVANIDIDVLDNDSDIDMGDVLTITEVSGAIGQAVSDGDSILYNPNGQFEAVARDETAQDVFSYIVSDGNDTATAMVTVTINGQNDPPAAFDDEPMIGEDAGATVIEVLDNDEDPDATDMLSVSGIDTLGTIGLVVNNGSSVSYDPNGEFESLAVGETATDIFRYLITDGLETGVATVTVTINGANDPPEADNDSASVLEIGPPILIDVLDNDEDVDLSDTLTITDVTGAIGVATSDGTIITYDPNGQFDSLEEGQTAVDTFTYTISDGKGGTVSAEVMVTVRGLSFGEPIQLKDIFPGDDNSSSPREFTRVGGQTFFSAEDALNDRELWRSDGTPSGTVMVRNINLAAGSFPRFLTDVDGTLFFQANDFTSFTEPWKSDGTLGGTALVKDINTVGQFASSSPTDLVNIDGTLFFTASDGINGSELWISDGTASGTLLVKDIRSGLDSSSPSNLTSVHGTLFFTADDGVNGRELWVSDGTESGTVMVKDIKLGSSSEPLGLLNVHGTLYFSADDGTHGRELWRSDGTALGTQLVADIQGGAAGSSPTQLTDVKGQLFFSADNGADGRELWTSDGTSAGTTLFADVNPGAAGSTPLDLTPLNHALFFTADDGARGRELWQSDGTASGTMLVRDLAFGDQSSEPDYLTIINGQLFFAATTSAGRELWQYNPILDEIMLHEISVGDSSPTQLTHVDGTLYFSAENRLMRTGFEPWVFRVGPNSPPMAEDNSFDIDEDDGPVNLTADLLRNDTEPDGDPLTVTSIDAAMTTGVLELRSGLVIYQPPTVGVGEVVTDTFTYTISDGRGAADTATVTLRVANDEDDDGVEDNIEDAAPGGGDGNGDGILDSQQANVTSLPSTGVAQPYLTVVSPNDTALVDVKAIENPSPDDSPPDVTFPFGFVAFRVEGVEEGEVAAIQMIVHAEEPVLGYWKYGREPEDDPTTPLIDESQTDHWWEFTFDDTTMTGVQIDAFDPDNGSTTITLNIVDGGRGDDDLIADGTIFEPGAPVSSDACLTAGPFSIGINRLTFSCVTPGGFAAFVVGTEEGEHHYDRWDVTVDIADPVVQAIGVANADGQAVVLVEITKDTWRQELVFQAFEMVPGSQVSNLVQAPPPLNPLDANRDGVVSALDALVIINQIGASPAAEGESIARTIDQAMRDYDTNHDGKLSPVDALLVINYIARLQSQSAPAADALMPHLVPVDPPPPGSLDDDLIRMLSDDAINSQLT